MPQANHEGATGATPSPPPRIAEKAALAVASHFAANRIVCTSTGRGQAAWELSQARPEAKIVLWYIDQFQQRLAIGDFAEVERQSGTSDSLLDIICASDLPPGECDLAIVPCSIRGEAELARDQLQQAFLRLTIGGHLIAAVDNASDRWLHQQLQALGSKVTVVPSDNATAYVVRKTVALRRVRHFDCEFSFRDCGNTVQVCSRPGVFSHRRLDPGAKAMLDAVAVQPNDRIIDIGCGSGAIGLALAMRCKNVTVLGIDSNIRAVQCTQRGALLNQFAGMTATLTSDGQCDETASYDVAICNPPYYANFRIAELFAQTASGALRPGGVAHFVTKQPHWYEQNLTPVWSRITVRPGRQYAIVTAVRA